MASTGETAAGVSLWGSCPSQLTSSSSVRCSPRQRVRDGLEDDVGEIGRASRSVVVNVHGVDPVRGGSSGEDLGSLRLRDEQGCEEVVALGLDLFALVSIRDPINRVTDEKAQAAVRQRLSQHRLHTLITAAEAGAMSPAQDLEGEGVGDDDVAEPTDDEVRRRSAVRPRQPPAPRPRPIPANVSSMSMQA